MHICSYMCALYNLQYDRDMSSKMEVTIREGIAAVVSEHCKCTVQPSDFTVGELRCAGEWLYVRSSVKETQSKDLILSAIDEWANSEAPTITMGVFSLAVNGSCSGRSSLLADKCIVF